MMAAFADFVARRLRLPADDLRARIFAGALMGGLVALFEVWQEQGGEVQDDALDVLLGALDFDLLTAGPKFGPRQQPRP
jgi:hypothetical protein